MLLVDKSALPSDHVLSSHTLHPAGLRVCDALGVGTKVRVHSPPMTSFHMELRGESMRIPLPPSHWAYCPRRERFDGLLQDAARAAGAELLDRTSFVDVLRRDGRVVGVLLRARSGRVHEARAELVVGADGVHSRVARAVGAQEYLAYDAPRGSYWGYFPEPRVRERALRVCYSGESLRFVFHTDEQRVLVGVAPPIAALAPFRADALAALRAEVAHDPWAAECTSRAPCEPLRGITSARYFLRRASGTGWALIGDAGVNREFVTGDGMTEALRQAEQLAEAFARGSEQPLADFWRVRDIATLPRFFFAKNRGQAGERSELDAALVRHVRSRPRLMARIADTLTYERLPQQTLSPARVLGVALAAALTGRARALSDFLRAGAEAKALARALQAAAARGAADSSRAQKPPSELALELA